MAACFSDISFKFNISCFPYAMLNGVKRVFIVRSFEKFQIFWWGFVRLVTTSLYSPIGPCGEGVDFMKVDLLFLLVP